MSNVVRLRDDDSEWGVSRVDASFAMRKWVREQQRARRALWLQHNVPIRDRRGKFVAAPKRNLGDVFETSSGQKAYVSRIANVTVAVVRESSSRTIISLPYVSILFGPRENGPDITGR